MCQNCHVFNGKYQCLDTAPTCGVDADALHTWTTAATHQISTSQESNAATKEVLHVTGKVPPAFVDSIISSLTNMGCAVTITHDTDDEDCTLSHLASTHASRCR